MAIEFVFGNEYVWPSFPVSGTYYTQPMDAADHKMGHHGRIMYAGTIAKIHVPISTLVQAPVNGIKVSLQGRALVGNNVYPDDTPTHYRVIPVGEIVANTVPITGLVTDDGTDLGAKKTVAVGDYVTVVVEFESFVAGDNYGGVLAINAGERCPLASGSWGSYDLGGGWNTAVVFSAMVLIEYEDGAIRSLSSGIIAAGSASNYAYVTGNVDSDPDEWGVKFVAPATGKIGGIAWWGRSGTGNDVVTLYDSGDNVLQAFTILRADENPHLGYINRRTWFDTPISVTAGATYRITLLPGGDGFLSYRDYGAEAAAAIVGGSNFVFTHRTDLGAWTDTPTRKALMVPFYTEFETGGGLAVPQSLHPIEAGVTA